MVFSKGEMRMKKCFWSLSLVMLEILITACGDGTTSSATASAPTATATSTPTPAPSSPLVGTYIVVITQHDLDTGPDIGAPKHFASGSWTLALHNDGTYLLNTF